MTLYQVSFSNHKFAAARCGRCHRPLTDPVSIRLGMGPECRGRSGGFMDSGLCKRDEFSDQFDGSIPFEQALVLKRKPRPVMFPGNPAEVGTAVTNVPHLVVHHSPDGYEFGFGGSGPTDLALNCCQLYLNMTGYEGQETKCYDGNVWRLAFALRNDFRDRFIASAQREGTVIPFATVDAWFRSHITPELINQFRIHEEE